MADNRETKGQGNIGGSTSGTSGGGGINEIREQLDNVNFPVTKNDLVNQVGTRNVNLGGKSMNFREVLNKVNKDRFESQDELMREIQNAPGMKDLGGTTGGTVGGGTTGGGKR